MNVTKYHLSVLAVIFIIVCGQISLFSLSGRNPIAADDNTIIYCSFENNNNDFYGHPVYTYGTWAYTSTSIAGNYSITQTADDRNHQKWHYTTEMALYH